MTAAAVQVCRCGHPERRHTDDDGCLQGECGCVEFRPGAAARPTAVQPRRDPQPPVARPAPPPMRSLTTRSEPPVSASGERPPTIEQLLQAGKRSQIKGIVKLSERIAVQVNDLRGRLHDEREAAEAKRRAEEQEGPVAA